MSLAATIFSIVILVTFVGQLVVDKAFNKEALATHQSLVEAMLGVVGTLFSVLLGLLVAGAIDNYQNIKMQVAYEANACGDIFRVARGLDTDERIVIRNLCREYARVVIEDEWPQMQQRQMSPKAWNVYQKLWEACVAIDIQNNRESNLHQAILAAMQTMGENRRARAVNCTVGLSSVLWLSIIAGA
ncbi:MAG TPA: hypothetical protein V6C72_00410, partial [Chroococcales cyanobacterium]